MKYTKLGNSKLKVSRICMGCMGFGDPTNGMHTWTLPRKESLEIINDPRKLLKGDERRPIKGKIQMFKSKYKNVYYSTHEQYVGKKVNWELLDQIENSISYKNLNMLSKIRSINASKFNEIKLNIQTIKGLKCTSFSVDELDNSYHCSCMFPNAMGKYNNLENTINEIDEYVPKLLVAWEKEIIITVNDNKSKIGQLDSSEQDIIDKILISQKLPGTIDFNIIITINNLLEDIEIKELQLSDLYDVLTSERDTLKVNELLDKVDEYVKNIVVDTENARIKIIKVDE